MTVFHRIKLGFTNVYLIRGKENYILVDAGPKNKLHRFKAEIERLRIAPNSIKFIVVTHSHYDHVGLLNELRDLTGAKIIAHRLELHSLLSGETKIPKATSIWGRILLTMSDLIDTTFEGVEPDIIIEDGLDLRAFGIEGRIIHTPGHTPGSISVLLDTQDAFIGDLMMSGLPLRLKPGLPVFAENLDDVRSSVKKLINEGAMRFHPSHGRFFNLKEVSNLFQLIPPGVL